MNHLQNDTSGSKSSNKRRNSRNKSGSKSKKQASIIQSTNFMNSSNLSNNEDTYTDSSKEKHKQYTGITSKFIKCAWEQHDKGDIDIAPEVYSKLSEDVTYKLWELGNNLKTYARHCGGHVSSDLVNDVLRDSNIPPVLGSECSAWDRIETDRAYYFPADRIIDLSKEYFKNIKEENCNDMNLSAVWISSHNNSKDLHDFGKKICNGIFIGFDDSFELALEIVATDPNIACVLGILLKEICNNLIEDYTTDILQKCLKFLNAIIYNPYTRDLPVDLDLISLCELLVCVILGPKQRHVKFLQEKQKFKKEYQLKESLKSCNVDENLTSPESEVTVYDKKEELEDFFRNYENIVKKTNVQDAQGEFSELKNSVKQENLESSKFNCVSHNELDTSKDITEVNVFDEDNPNPELAQIIDDPEFASFKNECDELLLFAIEDELRNSNQNNTVLPNFFDNLNIKKEKIDDLEDNNLNISSIQFDVSHIKQEKQDNVETSEINLKTKFKESFSPPLSKKPKYSSDDTSVEIKEFVKIYTKICKKKMILDVCKTFGLASAKWGYFEKVASLIVRGRLHDFFNDSVLWTNKSYGWLVRVIYTLWAIGEESFRNFFDYISKINPNKLPPWTESHLNIVSTYFRGQEDKIAYDWLYEICGDAIFPNMIYFSRTLTNLSKKYTKCKKRQKNVYKIVPKIRLAVIDRTICFNKPILTRDTIFEETLTLVERRKINFKFPGCRPPSNIKTKKICKIEKIEPNFIQIKKFDEKIIIAKRKILSVLTNEIATNKFVSFSDFIL